MLFSRIVAFRSPNFESNRNSVIEITATGIEALTVSPTLRTRYKDDAPKTIPRRVPTSRGSGVNSGNTTLAGMQDRKEAKYVLLGSALASSDDSLVGLGF